MSQISASIINGKVYANTTPDNTSKNKIGTDEMGKDQFFQILVAEMQYQDPLEPSSNTDWVSQMASFSQIEELQNVSSTITSGQTQDLVGKMVIVTEKTSSGTTQYVSGKVDSVEVREDGSYLSVNGYLYKSEDLYAVVDEDYYNQLTEEVSKK